ncbi:MAG: FkbM family methyltransferase [Proteobacteria bacterium]|nr:FkbM family methyltransferase [Pseudomonadota bacterium]
MGLRSRLNTLLRSNDLLLLRAEETQEQAAAVHLRTLLGKYQVDCVLDVGANMGQFHDFLLGAGWRGPVLSFEPVSTYYSAIAARAGGNWRCFNYALGNEDARLEIKVFDSPGLASIRPPDLQSMDALLPRGNVSLERTETITVRRLQDVLPEVAPQARRILLKTDTQGYDLEVFRGAGDMRERLSVLWAEVSFLPIYKESPLFQQALAEYTMAGFEVSSMFPVSHDPALRAIEFDCVLVRPAALPPG